VTKSVWDDPTMDERLRAMRKEGHAFSAIAKVLQVTRNSVVGRARRLKIRTDPMVTPIAKTRPQRAVASPDPLPLPEPPNMPKPEPDEPVAPPVRLLETIGWSQCRYPVDGPEPMCCGAPTVRGTSWCVNHLRQVFAPVPKRRERIAS
jgi:hypothetical protein